MNAFSAGARAGRRGRSPRLRPSGQHLLAHLADQLSRAARQPVFWAAIALLCLPFLLFWPVWWPAASVRQTFAYGDFVEQYYPMRAFVASEWRELRLPLWDPYTYAGTPAAAASLFAAFYPFNLWLALFPHPFPLVALELEAIFHLGLAGVFTLLLVRQWTGHTAAGLLSGAAFSLGGFLTSYPVLQLGILETAVWLPAGLWLLEVGLTRREVRRVALAGLAFAIALLAGHPQTFLYIAYVTIAYFVFRVWRLRLPWRFVMAVAAVLGAVTAGISAMQWLPSLELARLSPRASLSYAEVSNGFTLPELWGLLRPNPDQWSPLYIGWVPLGLAVLSLAVPVFRDRRERPRAATPSERDAPRQPISPTLGAHRADQRAEVWFWLAVATVALLLALGRNGFLYPIAHAIAPGFGVFRNQERSAFLVSFALSALAGYGCARLLDARRWSGTIVAGGLAVLMALTFVDLYRANHGLVLVPAQSAGYFPRTAVVHQLQGTGSPDWRTSTEGLLPGNGNAGLVFRIRDVSGNSPLHLAAYDRFLAQLPELRSWQLLNVQHLLTQRQLDHGALAPVITEDDRRLYQIFVEARPAWIVHDSRRAADVTEALVATAAPPLDPWNTAVLEVEPDPLPGPAAGPEDARLVRFEPQRIVIEAELSAPGILISSEVVYPGWIAYANGRPVPTLRAFGLLRAVALPEGSWRVEWRYDPLTMRAGLWLSSLTLAAVGWMLARNCRTTLG